MILFPLGVRLFNFVRFKTFRDIFTPLQNVGLYNLEVHKKFFLRNQTIQSATFINYFTNGNGAQKTGTSAFTQYYIALSIQP